MKRLVFLAACVLSGGAATVAACSSSTTTPTPSVDGGAKTDGATSTTDGATSTTDGATCGISDKAKFTAVTKLPTSDAVCPDFTAADLNREDTDAGPDAGPDKCALAFDLKTCTGKVDCEEGGVKTTGTFTASGGTLTGTLSLSYSDGDGGTIKCAYTVTLK